MFNEWQILIAWFATTAVTVGTIVWILAAQFSNIRALVYNQINTMTDKILEKLEYHEKHDDQRFGQITSEIQARSTSIMNDIWAIKLRNAAIDARKEQKLEDCRVNAQTKGKD